MRVRVVAVGLLLVLGAGVAGCSAEVRDDADRASRAAGPSPGQPSSGQSSAVDSAPEAGSSAGPSVPADRIPVGRGEVGPDDVVWALDRVLHVGGSAVRLPVRIDAFVVAPGGVYLRSDGALWLTDLRTTRRTGVVDVTELGLTADASALRVTSGSSARAWSTRTGRPVDAAAAVPATGEQLRGTRSQVVLAPERSDILPTAVPALRGPGRYGVLGGNGEPLIVYHAPSNAAVPMTGVVGDGFELVRWTGPTSFYGIARRDGQLLAVLGCDVTAGRCVTSGRIEEGDSPVFESGT